MPGRKGAAVCGLSGCAATRCAPEMNCGGPKSRGPGRGAWSPFPGPRFCGRSKDQGSAEPPGDVLTGQVFLGSLEDRLSRVVFDEEARPFAVPGIHVEEARHV